MVEVRLTWWETYMAAMLGTKRQIEALQKGLPDKHGANADHGWTNHIEGAAGEMAVAKYFNLYFDATLDTFKRPDIGDAWQVRTRSKINYELIVRDDDRDQDTFILVVGKAPLFHIVGWIIGADAKRAEWKQTYGGREAAYFVPQAAMNHVCTLALPFVASS